MKFNYFIYLVFKCLIKYVIANTPPPFFSGHCDTSSRQIP